MAINLGNAEDIKLVELPEDMQKAQEKLDDERQKQEEFLKPFLDNFCSRVRDRMMGMPGDVDVKMYIETMDIMQKVETVDYRLCDIKGIWCDIKEAKSGDEELYVFMDDFLEQVFYLYCAVELEYKKQEELKKQEEERLQEYDDLEKARPIFDMLKNEVRKWEWGNDFDEFTISKYIAEMVELGEKHNVDLGIDKVKDEDIKEAVNEQGLTIRFQFLFLFFNKQDVSDKK